MDGNRSHLGPILGPTSDTLIHSVEIEVQCVKGLRLESLEIYLSEFSRRFRFKATDLFIE